VPETSAAEEVRPRRGGARDLRRAEEVRRGGACAEEVPETSGMETSAQRTILVAAIPLRRAFVIGQKSVKLGARAARNASTGRTLPLRAQRECQATSESITDAQSASKDGRSRRGITGASPQKPSAALPNYAFIHPAAYRDKPYSAMTLVQQFLPIFEDGLRVGC